MRKNNGSFAKSFRAVKSVWSHRIIHESYYDSRARTHASCRADQVLHGGGSGTRTRQYIIIKHTRERESRINCIKIDCFCDITHIHIQHALADGWYLIIPYRGLHAITEIRYKPPLRINWPTYYAYGVLLRWKGRVRLEWLSSLTDRSLPLAPLLPAPIEFDYQSFALLRARDDRLQSIVSRAV